MKICKPDLKRKLTSNEKTYYIVVAVFSIFLCYKFLLRILGNNDTPEAGFVLSSSDYMMLIGVFSAIELVCLIGALLKFRIVTAFNLQLFLFFSTIGINMLVSFPDDYKAMGIFFCVVCELIAFFLLCFLLKERLFRKEPQPRSGFYPELKQSKSTVNYASLNAGSFSSPNMNAVQPHQMSQKVSTPVLFNADKNISEVRNEYMKKKNINDPNDLSMDDTLQISRYSMIPFAYFFYWIMMKGFFSPDIFQHVKESDIEACKKGSVTPLDLLEKIKFQLKDDYFTKEAIGFADYFLNCDHNTFNYHKFGYFYYEEIKKEDEFYYCRDFSWYSCTKLYKKIDKEYIEWSNKCFMKNLL